MVNEWKIGDALSAKNLNEKGAAPINKLLGTLDAGNGQPAREQTTARHIPVKATVKEIHDDYLVCKKTTEPDDAPDVIVAKPRGLRVSDFDGSTLVYPDGGAYLHEYFSSHLRKRTRQSDNVINMDQMFPPYLVDNSQIWIALQPDGTNLEVDGDPVRYLDLNVDGRSFFTEGAKCTPRDVDAARGDTTLGYLYSRISNPTASDADDGKIREGAMINITLHEQHANEYIKLAHACPVNEGSKTTLGSAAERTTTDGTYSWTSCTGVGLEVYDVTGVYYDHTVSTPSLKAQWRKKTFDNYGHLYNCAIETEAAWETPEACA